MTTEDLSKMVIVTKATREFTVVLQNDDCTVLALVRETLESVVVQDANGMQRGVDGVVLEVRGRGQSAGLEADRDPLVQCRAALRALVAERSDDAPVDLPSVGQACAHAGSHASPEWSRP
jgi:hypothetical protein